MPIFEANASASSIECVVKTTEDCFRNVDIREITVHINRRAPGSIPVDGSSRNIIGGLPIRANATESLRLLPPLS